MPILLKIYQKSPKHKHIYSALRWIIYREKRSVTVPRFGFFKDLLIKVNCNLRARIPNYKTLPYNKSASPSKIQNNRSKFCGSTIILYCLKTYSKALIQSKKKTQTFTPNFTALQYQFGIWLLTILFKNTGNTDI